MLLLLSVRRENFCLRLYVLEGAAKIRTLSKDRPMDFVIVGLTTYVEAVANAVIHDWKRPHQKRNGFLRTNIT